MKTSGIGFLIREMSNRGLRVIAEPPDWKHRIEVVDDVGADWKTTAGTLVNSIESMDWVFGWGVSGRVSGHDWLQCNSCDEVRLVTKAKGAPSQKSKCILTPACKGIMRRLPEIFVVTKPKKPRKPRVKKVDPVAETPTMSLDELMDAA